MAEEKTIEELEEIIATAKEPGERAEALWRMAIKKEQKGNYPSALEYFQKALLHYESIGDKKLIAFILNEIGYINSHQGDYKTAIEYHHKSLRAAEEIDDKQRIGYALSSIGMIHFHLGDYPVALEYQNKVLRMQDETGNKRDMSITLGNLGAVHLAQGNYPLALEFLQKEIDLKEELGLKHDIDINYNNVGAVNEKLNNHELALEYYYKALGIREEAGDKRGIAFSIHNIGFIFKKEGKHAKALPYLERALELAEEIGHKEAHRETLKLLYEIKKAQGDTGAALNHHEKYVALKEEMTNNETSKQITNLKVGHELELNEKERKLIEGILLNILPKPIANRIKEGHEEIIEKHEQASVLFADIVGFTTWSEKMAVKELAQHLNKVFHLFDELAAEHGVEKIKTIGDAYMCVAGLPEPCEYHAERIAGMALDMNSRIKTILNGEIKLRIGIHTGEVIAGVIGKNKYAYDLWGDTVNTASRMESHSIPGRIQVTEEFKNLLTQTLSEGEGLNTFRFEERGEIEIKGKGKMRTWFLEEK